jgi:hypothetical protein
VWFYDTAGGDGGGGGSGSNPFAQQNNAGYASEMDTISVVDTLVSRRLLLKTSNWSIARPTYLCTIRRAMAEQIAISLKFNLHDFMFNKTDSVI